MSEPLESLALEAAGDIDDGKSVAGLSELLRALAGACRQRDALRAQEPVAQVLLLPERVGFGRIEERKQVKLLVDVPVGAALYTAPQPPREVERLTDQEIIAVAPPEIPERYDDDLVYFARAIERALAEKAGFVLKDPT